MIISFFFSFIGTNKTKQLCCNFSFSFSSFFLLSLCLFSLSLCCYFFHYDLIFVCRKRKKSPKSDQFFFSARFHCFFCALSFISFILYLCMFVFQVFICLFLFVLCISFFCTQVNVHVCVPDERKKRMYLNTPFFLFPLFHFET